MSILPIAIFVTLIAFMGFMVLYVFSRGKKKTIEIEHRYKVDDRHLQYLTKKLKQFGGKPQKIIQGYLSDEDGKVVRVRINTVGRRSKAYLTIKGQKVNGVCDEFEYTIPVYQARKMLGMCKRTITKTRYKMKRWEIDFFEGHLEGLVIAEIELSSVDEPYEKPLWLGIDITNDHAYSNNNLAKRRDKDA